MLERNNSVYFAEYISTLKKAEVWYKWVDYNSTGNL